jgi:hypothetical protein
MSPQVPQWTCSLAERAGRGRVATGEERRGRGGGGWSRLPASHPHGDAGARAGVDAKQVRAAGLRMVPALAAEGDRLCPCWRERKAGSSSSPRGP